jgi:hypothetical protein
VHVRIHESREEVAPGPLDELRALGRLERSRRAELGDLAVAHEDVVRAVDPLRGSRRGAADEQSAGRAAWTERAMRGGRGSGGVPARAPARTSYRTAMRTTTPASTWR